MSIGPPIPEVQHFRNLTLKIHGQGQTSSSQSRHNTLSTHVSFVPCRSALPFLGYSYFKIWRWKFKVKVMGEVKVESHNMGPTFNQLTSLWSFVPCQLGIPFLTFSNFDLENQGSSSWVRSQFKVTAWVLHTIDSHPFRSMSIVPAISDTAFSKFDLENPGSRSKDHDAQLQVLTRTPTGINPWVPQSLIQVLPHLTSFWPMGRPIWDKWANDHDAAQLEAQTIRNSIELRTEKIRQAVTEIWVRQFWQPPARPPGPWQVFGPWVGPYGTNGQMTMMLHN